jgi:nucleoside-diphosphate-sugar epimerase
MKKVVITGAGGFIGRSVAHTWHSKGYEVHALAFNEQEAQLLQQMGLKVHQGDVREKHRIHSIIAGARYVIHVAAKVSAKGDLYDFYDINVRGTHHVLEASQQAGVECVVLFSTAGLLGFAGRDGSLASEKDLGKKLPEDSYVLTKEMARHLATLYNKNGLRVVSLMPTTVYGPGPFIPSNGFTKIIHDYSRRFWPFIIGSGKQIRNFVYVEDVAQVTYQACLDPEARGDYLLGGENCTMDDFFFTLRTLSQKRDPLFHVPRQVLLGYARMMEIWDALRGKKGAALRPVVDRLTLSHPVHAQRLTHELGFQPTSLREGIQRTLEWLKHGEKAGKEAVALI